MRATNFTSFMSEAAQFSLAINIHASARLFNLTGRGRYTEGDPLPVYGYEGLSKLASGEGHVVKLLFRGVKKEQE